MALSTAFWPRRDTSEPNPGRAENAGPLNGSWSRRSLELRPNYYGYLDTLGRCYYTSGDLANAL